MYLNDIFIYTKDLGQLHVNIICRVLYELKKYDFFINFKKSYFYQDKVKFFNYIVFAYEVNMKDKRIQIVKDKPELNSICNIQIFIGFTNIYNQFLKGFNRILAPLTSMLKITIKQISSKRISLQKENVDKGMIGSDVNKKSNLVKTKIGFLSKFKNRAHILEELAFLIPKAKPIFIY